MKTAVFHTFVLAVSLTFSFGHAAAQQSWSMQGQVNPHYGQAGSWGRQASWQEMPAQGGNGLPPTQLPVPAPVPQTQPRGDAIPHIDPAPRMQPRMPMQHRMPPVTQPAPTWSDEANFGDTSPMTIPRSLPSVPSNPCCDSHGQPGAYQSVLGPTEGQFGDAGRTSDFGSGCCDVGNSCDSACPTSCGPDLCQPGGRLRAMLAGGGGTRGIGGMGFGGGAGGLCDKPMYMFIEFGNFFGDSPATFRNTDFDIDDDFLRGAGIGRYLTRDLRVDFSARYRYVEVDADDVQDIGGFDNSIDGGTNVWTSMLTARHDLPGFHPCIKPYISGGVGFADHNTHASVIQNLRNSPNIPGFISGHRTDDTIEFAWSVGAGIACKMTQRMFIDLDYQFINLGDAFTGTNDFGEVVSFEDLTGNEFAIRLRYNF